MSLAQRCPGAGIQAYQEGKLEQGSSHGTQGFVSNGISVYRRGCEATGCNVFRSSWELGADGAPGKLE